MNEILNLIDSISSSGLQWILTLFSIVSSVGLFLYTNAETNKINKQLDERELEIKRCYEHIEHQQAANKKEAAQLKHEREQLNIEIKKLADEKAQWTIDTEIGEEY